MDIDSIDWNVINKNLPCKKTAEESKKRQEMFKHMDVNGNGYISLAEIDKGFNDMGESMRIVYLSKAAMMRAFSEAKNYVKSSNEIA